MTTTIDRKPFTHEKPPALRRLTGLAALALPIALVATAGCSSSPATETETDAPLFEIVEDTAEPVGGIDSVTWSLMAEPESLAYTYSYDPTPNQVLSNVCDRLLTLNPDLSVSPGLAESWEQTSDTTWAYQLRDDVTFHDGTPLTPDDVVASLSRHLDPEIGSFWYGIMRNIASVDKTGDSEVTITTTAPNTLVHYYLAATPGTVESAATLEEAGEAYGTPDGGLNCSGPYSLASWTPGAEIVLEKNEQYWNDDAQALADSFTFVFQPDSSNRVAAWRTGEVDGGWQVPSDAIATLNEAGTGAVAFGETTAMTNEVVGNLDGPLGDPAVRQALLMAIDREGIIEAGEHGYGTVANALAPESVWVGASDAALEQAFGELNGYDYDPEAAKALAEEAGVDGETVVIATSNVTPATAILSEAVADAAETIGLTPELQTIPPAEYGRIFTSPEEREGIDLFFTFWDLPAGNPLAMYTALRTGEFPNYGAWSSPEFDEIVTEALAVQDPAAQSELAAEAQLITNAELPWLPLYSVPNTVWQGERITGVSPSMSYIYSAWAASVGAAE